ncbi:MAG: UbiA family prenyltransferase [Akkermansiaceae bacterium]
MRWWTYQKERFPIFQHGLLVLAFSSSAVAYSSMLCGVAPEWRSFLVAFVTVLIFFLQLRIADEFKDAEEDAKYRPYRAVPRGLVSLKELGIVFAVGMALQLGLTIWLDFRLLILLLVTWGYLALMSVEFFARDWLKSRHITYLWTHMLIMPLVDLFATACLWLPIDASPHGLIYFLIASFFNGIVIEIGRKLRQPEKEQEGVPTYSKLWGLRKASWVWLGCVITTAAFAVIAAVQINFVVPVISILSPLLLWAAWTSYRHSENSSKRFELIAGLWTLALYLSLGLIPLLTLFS